MILGNESAPVFLDDESANSRKETAYFVDAFARQLKELFVIDNSHRLAEMSKDELVATEDFTRYEETMRSAYVHVYYPWNNHLVKTVGKEDYLRLKTDRNQDLITKDEQATLRTYRVAVCGLSVGSNIAFTLTQAGISNEIVIADFDELDTTNLNRILAGVHQVGLNKAVIAARRIYEDNPFAEVTPLVAGIDAEQLKSLLDAKRIDCIIDEVDDIRFKVECRLLAKEYKVPVVMLTDNGDGVVLHVERYDLGYDKILGKDITHFEALRAGKLSKAEAGKMIMEDVVGGVHKVDPAMLASVRRTLAHELVSWSQLGSAAILGGVIVTYMLKHIALGKNADPDIRAYIFPHSGVWERHS